MSAKYAYPVSVVYRWPDEETNFDGTIVVTNEEEYTVTCEKLGINDDDVIIYTESLEPGYVSEMFDGLIIEEILEIGKTVAWEEAELPLIGNALHIHNLNQLFDLAWDEINGCDQTPRTGRQSDICKMALTYLPSVIQDLSAEEGR